MNVDAYLKALAPVIEAAEAMGNAFVASYTAACPPASLSPSASPSRTVEPGKSTRKRTTGVPVAPVRATPPRTGSTPTGRPDKVVVAPLRARVVRGPNESGRWYWRIVLYRGQKGAEATLWTGWATSADVRTHLERLAPTVTVSQSPRTALPSRGELQLEVERLREQLTMIESDGGSQDLSESLGLGRKCEGCGRRHDNNLGPLCVRCAEDERRG